MATFTENTWRLKKIVGVARYDPGVSMGQMPNASIYQSPSAPKELTSPNRACEAGTRELVADSLRSVTAGARRGLGFAGRRIAHLLGDFGRCEIESWRMRVMASDALLRPGMVSDHDLPLLQRSPGQPFVAEGAELSRVRRNSQLEVGWVIGPGRRSFEHAVIVPLAGSPMADLTLNDLSDVGAVVDAFEPISDLLGVARRTISDAFVLRLVRGDLSNRVAPVMTEFVE